MKLSRRIATIAATGILAAGLVTPAAHAASSEATHDISSEAVETILAHPGGSSSFVEDVIVEIAIWAAFSSALALCPFSSNNACTLGYTRN